MATAFPIKDGEGNSLHMSEAQFVEAVADPEWRIKSGALYRLVDVNKKVVPFVPNEVQAKFIDTIWYRNVVPKARKRGFSTVIQLMMLDSSLFVPDSECVVIAQDDQTAKDILESKFKFAWERLPPIVHEMVQKVRDNVHEMKFSNGSIIIAASTSRGKTPSWLHISEFGIICLRDPAMADEILSGAIPSVPETGIIAVESTIESLEGHFVEMVGLAQAAEQAAKTARRSIARQEWRLHFASWWDADEYRSDPQFATIGPKDQQYFDRIEGEIGRKIELPRRAWYVLKRTNDFNGSSEKMNKQFPSTLKEAMQASTEGKWLGEQMARTRIEGRITQVPLVPGIPVNTWWDIGIDDDVAIWLHQMVGPRDHWVGFLEGSSEAPTYFVSKLQAMQAQRNFVWGSTNLPHDADHRVPGVDQLRTYRDMIAELGLPNVFVVPRIHDLVAGINQLRDDFPNYWFDAEFCKTGLEHCDGYSKVWNKTVGTWSDQVRKNGHQHAADALRQKAQMAHRLRTQGAGGWKRKGRRSAMAS